MNVDLNSGDRIEMTAELVTSLQLGVVDLSLNVGEASGR
jgi:hypothetical protein